MTQYLVGYYKPSLEFTRIPEFMGVFDRKGTLVGVTGPSTSRQAALDARLFAAAPELLLALNNLCKIVNEQMHNRAQNRENGAESETEMHTALRRAEQLRRLVEEDLIERLN